MESTKVDNLGFKITTTCWIAFLYLGLMWAWEYHSFFTKAFGVGGFLTGVVFLFVKATKENKNLRKVLFYGSIVLGVISIAFQ